MTKTRTRSREAYEKARRLIPGGVNSPVRAFGRVGGWPVYFKKAKGSRFEDIDGNEYVDFCMSWGPLILGHARPEVVDAVCRAAQDGLSYGACHEREVEIAELVLSAFPGFQRVRFTSSGTEAVMTALRIARAATGRDLVLKFDGGYHGHFDGMLVKAGSGLATQAIADSRGVPAPIAETTLVAPFDDEERVQALFDAHRGKIAAVIIEPLPANNGLLVQRREFLAFLREITLREGAVLIFDEVISGFRLRFGGYGESVGVKPDLVTLGKIVGGGMPVGAVVGRASELDLLAPSGSVYQAGTLSGNPVSLAAGIATLQILRREEPYARLDRAGARFEATLLAGGRDDLRLARTGSVLWLYLDAGEPPRRADRIIPEAMERFNRIFWPLLERGFYFPPSPYEVFFLSTSHTDGEIEAGARAVIDSLAQEGT